MAVPIINVQDVSLNNLSIRSAIGNFDLVPLFVELTIEESLFRSSLTGNIILADSFNLPTKLPIVGEETLDIDISMVGLEDLANDTVLSVTPPKLHVNSLKARYFTKPKAQIFTLDLVSEQYISSLHSKVSKSYRGKTISSIADDIYFRYLDDGERGMSFLPTERIENIVIPNLSPIDAIDWLAKRAQKDSAVNYLFFETMDESYFVTLDHLAKQEPVVTFIHKARSDDPTGMAHIATGVFKINKFYFKHQFNKKHNIERGVYSSKLITHDIVTKKITQHEYTGFNEWFAFNHCGDFPPLSNSDIETKASGVARTTHAPSNEANKYPTTDERNLARQIDSHVEFFPKHNQMYALNTNDLYDNKVEDWKLRRNAHIGIYDGITLVLEVSGNSGLRVGQIVNVILPSPETTDRDKKSDGGIDKFLSGKYMVTAIQHIFSQITQTDPKIKYDMKIEVTKDGLEEQVPFRESRKED